MDIDFFKSSIYDGMTFKKVREVSNIICVADEGFTYKIGNNGNYKKYYIQRLKQL